jgi:glyoxylase-like metal-dependent hydrolase (beta-lactamase superfamily II)
MTNAKSPNLEFRTINTSLGSLAANVVIIIGEESVILVDVPFTRADAYRVIAEILDIGKPLDTILVTHDHPDHFFGLDVTVTEFPNAKVIAEPSIAAEIGRSSPIKFNRWSPMMGMNAPRFAYYPKPYDGDHLMLEGHRIDLRGPIQGDHATCQYVWVPESRTLLANDILYNQVHLFLGEHLEPQYDAWLAAVDELEALKPETVIAGHRRPDLTDDSGAIDFTRRYLIDFKRVAAEGGSSEVISNKMIALYPDAIDVASNFLLGTSSQVASREIEPWDE